MYIDTTIHATSPVLENSFSYEASRQSMDSLYRKIRNISSVDSMSNEINYKRYRWYLVEH